MSMRSCVAAAMLLGSGISHAGLLYSESASGDLHGAVGNPLAPRFALSPGTNTITGTTHIFRQAVGFDADQDSFLFELGIGQSITAISIAFTLTNKGSDGGIAAWSIFNQTHNVDVFGPSPVSMFSSVLPLTNPLQQSLDVDLAAGLSCTGCTVVGEEGWSADYTLTVTVGEPQLVVPEPAILTLLVLGLAGLGAIRRRP